MDNALTSHQHYDLYRKYPGQDSEISRLLGECGKNTIEATFEALIRIAADLEAESQSHVALGLAPEEKPVFDLLMREDLSKEEVRQIKSASIAVLQAIRRRMEDVQDIFQKQSTRDGLRQEIYDLLYDDRTGLPATKYDDEILTEKTDAVFQHFMHQFDMRASDVRIPLH